MKNVTDKGKLAQFLNFSIGSVHYNSLPSYLGPEKPMSRLSYDSLIKSFKQMLYDYEKCCGFPTLLLKYIFTKKKTNPYLNLSLTLNVT